MRTLAHDIAQAIGALGVVVRLHRTQDGPFNINQAVSLDADLENNILPMENVLGNLQKINVSADIVQRVFPTYRPKT